LINHNVDNIFNRSGLAALSDLGTPGYQSIFAQLEKEQETFLEKEAEFRSADYKWPRDPLHNWSRAWEYPYAYYHLSKYLKTLPQNSRPVVADVGSGVTFFPFSLAKIGYHVVCTDIDQICKRDLLLARKCVSHSPGEVNFRLIEDSNLPFKDSECDVVYCISVLEHISAFEKTVTEIARILKPGGLCLITCDINLQTLNEDQLDVRGYARLVSTLANQFIPIFSDRTKRGSGKTGQVHKWERCSIMKVSDVQKCRNEAKAAVTHSPAAALLRMGHGIWAMDNRLVQLAPSPAFSACFLPPPTENPRGGSKL